MALKLTSVKLEEKLFEDFKVASIRQKFNLQKLVNRSIHLYLTDEEFAKQIHTHNSLTISIPRYNFYIRIIYASVMILDYIVV